MSRRRPCASQVADSVMEDIEAERLLVLHHPKAEQYYQHKAADHDRWLAQAPAAHGQEAG